MKKKNGFTIIEMVIVTSIIGILTVLVLVKYQNNQSYYSVNQLSQQLLSDIRRAQNMSMNGINIGSYYGFGVYASNNDDYYIIYADINGDNSYQPSDSVIETINLTDNVEITNVAPLSDYIDIFYESPDPIAYINGSSASGLSGAITLGIPGQSKVKTISVTTAGLAQQGEIEGYCQGTASGCSSFGEQSSCGNQDGCSWNPEFCAGTCILCEELGGFLCRFQDGCDYIGGGKGGSGSSCQGTCQSCDTYDSWWPCVHQMGCSWIYGYCSGAVVPCENYDSESICLSQQGCDWIIP